MKSTHQPEYKKLLEELIKVRKQAGITQQQLAHKLKKPQSFVSKYEQGERRLDVIEFIRVTALIGTDYKMLIDKALKEK